MCVQQRVILFCITIFTAQEFEWWYCPMSCLRYFAIWVYITDCAQCNDYYVNIVLNTIVETMYLIHESNLQFFPCKGYKGLFLNSEKWSFARNKCIQGNKVPNEWSTFHDFQWIENSTGLLIVFTMSSPSFLFPKEARPEDNQCDNNWICKLVPG